jgi:hypothetical protein
MKQVETQDRKHNCRHGGLAAYHVAKYASHYRSPLALAHHVAAKLVNFFDLYFRFIGRLSCRHAKIEHAPILTTRPRDKTRLINSEYLRHQNLLLARSGDGG